MARSLTGVLLKDKWRIDALLGEGGVAAVYAATHRNGKRVAVKVLHPHLASIAEVRERFLREGYVANRVDHPGSVGVLDDDVTDDGLVFLVMELLDGESLDKRVQRDGRLPADDVLAITDVLLDVLAAAHEKGILHRDIKPDNVFALRSGRIKLLDFGIARLHEQQSASTATQTGAAMGTPAYMPPEQARGRWEDVDARTDLWAVGATMYSLLVGRCVHEADTVNETLLLAMMKAAPRLASAWPEAPAALASVVDRALAFDREDRWPDARTMQQAVRDAMGAPGPTVAANPPAAPTTTLPSSRSPSTPEPLLAPSPARGTLLAGTMTPAPITPRAPLSRRLKSRAAIGAAAGAVALGLLGVVLLLETGRPHTEAPLQAPATPTTFVAPVETASVSLAPPPSAILDLPPAPPPGTASTLVAAAPLRAPAPARPALSAVPVATRPSATPASNPLDRRK